MIDQVLQYCILIWHPSQFGDKSEYFEYFMWWDHDYTSDTPGNTERGGWVRNSGVSNTFGDLEPDVNYHVIPHKWPESGWVFTLNFSQVPWLHCAECGVISYNDYLCGECRG